jgi:hypothetical protein
MLSCLRTSKATGEFFAKEFTLICMESINPVTFGEYFRICCLLLLHEQFVIIWQVMPLSNLKFDSLMDINVTI